MKLWLFTFTQANRQFASARVAASTQAEAAAIMGMYVQRPLVGSPYKRPEPGTFLQYFGEDKSITAPCLISAIDAQGQLQVPPQ